MTTTASIAGALSNAQLRDAAAEIQHWNKYGCLPEKAKHLQNLADELSRRCNVEATDALQAAEFLVTREILRRFIAIDFELEATKCTAPNFEASGLQAF